jgi:murein L,D-transpeptidase YafK
VNAVTLATLALIMMCGGVASSKEPPSSARSREAIGRVRPELERQLVEKGASYGSPVFMRVFKEEAELEVWVDTGDRFILFRTYEICAASGTLGPKQRRGDGQCPEGFYYVSPTGLNPHSTFHLSFDIGYPNEYDRQLRRTGSAIMVHGDCVSIGCFAMTDAGIEEIYALADAALRGGQPFFRVHVFPFRMTRRNMEAHRDSEWYGFWRNLKEGYDYFEAEGRPPDVRVARGRYVFASL